MWAPGSIGNSKDLDQFTLNPVMEENSFSVIRTPSREGPEFSDVRAHLVKKSIFNSQVAIMMGNVDDICVHCASISSVFTNTQNFVYTEQLSGCFSSLKSRKEKTARAVSKNSTYYTHYSRFTLDVAQIRTTSSATKKRVLHEFCPNVMRIQPYTLYHTDM